MSCAPALLIEHVTHAYGERVALDDVSFTVARGSCTALLGLNGAGKTTLFSLVTRLFAARRGRISVFGFDIDRDPGEALRRLGVVFQARTLDLDLSVAQNLRYHAALHGLGGREAKARGAEMLARMELSGRAGEKARHLSGGQMRRVEIARALLHAPRLLVLDEPTVGLDINSRAGILRHLRALVAQTGLTVLWATHLLDEVEPTDEVVVLHKGRILATGSAQVVIAAQGKKDIGGAFSALIAEPATADAESPQ
ncbi:MAG: ATP-binding cassette domain-containing protein [Hyphomicrobiales bacterium]|nr:ATP-binding cassette domain-containing protein [Hyphomicrobiales bacterium]MBV9976440.1 ATP-binding cassette domain-containing protein [Hyphomicrobiales bacterium]